MPIEGLEKPIPNPAREHPVTASEASSRRPTWLVEVASAYLRRTPIGRGQSWLRRRLLQRMEAEGFSGTRVVTTRHGFAMAIDLRDHLGRRVWTSGEYEPFVTRYMLKTIRTGMKCVDVGANSGYYTLLAAARVGRTGRVYSYEPIPLCLARIENSVQRNRFGNVTLRNIALSDTCGTATLTLGPASHLGISTLRQTSDSGEQIAVTTSTIDDEFRDESIDVMKIDVEGLESRVLRGAMNLIERCHPDLFLEVADKYLREAGSSALELIHGLEERGYRCYTIHARGRAPLRWTDDDAQRKENVFASTKSMADL